MQNPLRYSLTRAQDLSLQWEPPVGSTALADALSYHYPFEKSMLGKMQKATDDFLNQQKRAEDLESAYNANAAALNGHFPLPTTLREAAHFSTTHINTTAAPHQHPLDQEHNMPAPKLEPADPTEGNTTTAWHVLTGLPAKTRGRKGPLNPKKRKRIAENRGNTCANHKKSKTLCDADICPENKLYIKRRLAEKPPEASMDSGHHGPVGNMGRGSLNPNPPEHHQLRLEIPFQQGVSCNQVPGQHSPTLRSPLQHQHASEKLSHGRTPSVGSIHLRVPSFSVGPRFNSVQWSPNTARSPSDARMGNAPHAYHGDLYGMGDGEHLFPFHLSPNSQYNHDTPAWGLDVLDNDTLDFFRSSRPHSPLFPGTPILLSPQPSVLYLSPQPSSVQLSSPQPSHAHLSPRPSIVQESPQAVPTILLVADPPNHPATSHDGHSPAVYCPYHCIIKTSSRPATPQPPAQPQASSHGKKNDNPPVRAPSNRRPKTRRRRASTGDFSYRPRCSLR